MQIGVIKTLSSLSTCQAFPNRGMILLSCEKAKGAKNVQNHSQN
ncbi:hypothetical protein HMPREF1054_0947 [Haemophilus paraphrohaemolyticus HK411]|uniref:Uncharacterized protein n=1 Tax=Haemophilus paraphrohaemolyticus HK411 TaxID=1095743 RepID=I2NPZ9_9PAST|nr:hypothetical protein HMPREF1054_0947 [Haemophilus paraphrohaemolyticus HK411]